MAFRTNRLYFRANDKITSEGEAYPDLVPEGTPAADVPVRERLMTVTEEETEIGWHSDYVTRNRFGQGSAGLRVWQTDVDYSTFLREDWDRFVYRTTDPRRGVNVADEGEAFPIIGLIFERSW